MTFDYTSLGSGLLDPRRTAGPLPDDPRRAFLHAVPCPRCKGTGLVGGYSGSPDEWEDDAWTCGPCRGTGDAPGAHADAAPSDRHRHAVLTAPHAAARAEAHAWELMDALAPWGLPTPGRLVWRVHTHTANGRRPYLQGLPFTVSGTLSLLFFTHWRDELRDSGKGIAIGRPPGVPHQPYDTVRSEARTHAAWEAAARQGLRFPDTIRHANGRTDTSDHPLAGRPFADLPNPHVPLLRIWRTGFALDRVTDDTVTLYAAPYHH